MGDKPAKATGGYSSASKASATSLASPTSPASPVTKENAEALAKAKLALSTAMEEHDLDELRAIIPRAANLGINEKEVEHARAVLHFLEEKVLEQESSAASLRPPCPIMLKRELSEAVEEHDLAALRRLVPMASEHGVDKNSLDRAVTRLEFIEYGTKVDAAEDAEATQKLVQDLLTCKGHAPVGSDAAHENKETESDLLAELKSMYPDTPTSLLERAAQGASSLDEALDVIMAESY